MRGVRGVSMTKPIIDTIFASFEKKMLKKHTQLDFMTRSDLEALKQELKKEIKNKAHWMYPKYSDSRHDIISLTAHELVGDLI